MWNFSFSPMFSHHFTAFFLPKRLAERRVSYQRVDRWNWNSKVPTCTVQALHLGVFKKWEPRRGLTLMFWVFTQKCLCWKLMMCWCKFFLVFGRGRTCPRLKFIGFLCFAFCFYSLCFPQSFLSVFLFFAFRDVFILVLPCFWSDFCVLLSVSIPSVFPNLSFCFLVFRFSRCFYIYLFFLVFGWGMTCLHLKLIGFLCFAFCFYSFCFPQSFPSVFLFFAFGDIFILVLPCFWVR